MVGIKLVAPKPTQGSALNDVTSTTSGLITTDAKTALVGLLWSWLHAHANDAVLKINWWIIQKTFRWSDLFPAIALLIGPDPTSGRFNPRTGYTV